MRILGIETSCDETSAAVVQDGCILSNIISSQVDLHSIYGGIVPEIASRQHLKIIDAVIIEAIRSSKILPETLDAVAVTRGPGLPSALLVGVSAARGLALRLGKPLIPIHHMEAHLYSAALDPLPFIALVVSGGHTLLIHGTRFGEHRVLGQTLDDAAGEAFDKAAQLLGLGYPGGPQIEKEARRGNHLAYDFPRPMLESGDWNFSFSGLKTAFRRTIAALQTSPTLSLTQSVGTGFKPAPTSDRDDRDVVGDYSVTTPLPKSKIADLCASFQAAVVEVLVEKTIRAAKTHGVPQITVSGGVACNQALRERFEQRCSSEGIRLAFADQKLCTDNAAMIALLAEKKQKQGFTPPSQWDIDPDWVLAMC